MMEKITNKDHEFDINHAEQHTRWILTLLGIWPSVESNPTGIARYASKFWLLCPSLLILANVIPIVCNVVIRDVFGAELIANVGLITYLTSTMLINCIIISRRGTIKFCMRHIEFDWRRVENRHERDIMLRNLEVGRVITVTGILAMFGTAVLFNITPLFSGSYVNSLNQSVRPLIYPGADIFVDLRYGFNYEIVYISNGACVFFLQLVITAMCNLAAVFVTHACGQIQIVMSRLDGLVDRDENASDIVTAHDRIAFIVRNHVRALRFASIVDAFLREMCLIEVTCSTLAICWVEYACLMVKIMNHRKTFLYIMFLNSSLSAALTEWQNRDFLALTTYFLSFISLCFNLFIFCHIGELLKEQYQQVGRAAYMNDWYKLPDKTTLTLILIISMANYPCKLTAGQMMELSYYSFGSIMKTSFAYLNMLRTITE